MDVLPFCHVQSWDGCQSALSPRRGIEALETGDDAGENRFGARIDQEAARCALRIT